LGKQYIIKGQHTEFHKNLLQLISNHFQIEKEGNTKETDKKLNTMITGQKYTGYL